MTFALVLYAPNVHTGGGLILLKGLMASVKSSEELILFLDVRAYGDLKTPGNSKVIWINATVASRLAGEFALRRVAMQGTTVVCFHGLPPLLPNAARIVVFQQNRNLLGLNLLNQFALKTRLRLIFERFVSRVFRHRVAEYIVQTPSMQRAVLQWYGARGPVQPAVRILPFVAAPYTSPDNNVSAANWDFVYVADGESHKNHRTLFAAWQLLAQD